MSEHITHIAVYEDTYRIIQHAEDLDEAFKTSVKNFPDIGLMCSASRGNHLFAVPFLEDTRDKWDTRKDGDGTEEKIAAALGWLSHRAIDLQVKPNYLRDDELKDPRFSEQENQIYYDAITFRKVYNSGKAKSLSPYVYLSQAVLEENMQSHPGAEFLHISYLEPSFFQLIQQNMIGMRKFNQEATTPEDWLKAFPDQYQDPSENLRIYIEAYTHPDPQKMKRYSEALNFYNEEDELIRYVREIQYTGKSDISLEEAYKKAESQSHYAQGLRRSYYFMRMANDFFNKNMEKSKLYDELGIFTESHRR